MLAVPLATAGLTTLPAAAAPAYAVTATINVGSYPVGVGVDPSAHTVYVSSSNGASPQPDEPCVLVGLGE